MVIDRPQYQTRRSGTPGRTPFFLMTHRRLRCRSIVAKVEQEEVTTTITAGRSVAIRWPAAVATLITGNRYSFGGRATVSYHNSCGVAAT
jgi:hypothetical protein